jgi:predicted TIM-barrel fold metal-dependent hydrolase
MRIDVHAHYWTDAYLDMLVALGRTDTATQRGIGAGGGAELEARLRLMDRAGVDMQVLSAAPQLPYGGDTARALAAARYVNDEYAAVVTEHPDGFRAFAATPMPHIDAAIAEIARALDELGMVGVTMNNSSARSWRPTRWRCSVSASRLR